MNEIYDLGVNSYNLDHFLSLLYLSDFTVAVGDYGIYK